MMFTLPFLAAFTAALTSVSAAPTPADGEPRNPVIGPFALKIESANSTWNHKYLSNIHIGAAINLAIPVDSADTSYFLNSTDYGYESDNVQYGRLTFDGNPEIPYAGGLEIDTSSNVAALLISVLEPTLFNFNSKGHLQINGLERWFICTIQTSYGPKAGIAWEFGTGAPSIPDCAAVSLVKTH